MDNENNEALLEEEMPEKKRNLKLPPLMLIGIAALVLLVIIASAIAIADRADSAGQKRTHGAYSINSDSVLDMVSYSSGVAVLTSDSLDYVDAFGNLMSANEHTYTNPVLVTAGKNAILYDRGGNAMKIEKNASMYKTFSFEAPVSCADITASGTYVYVLNADKGYQSHLFVFSYKGKKLFEWSSSEYVVRAALSENGNCVAVSTVSLNNADVVSKVYLFQFNRDTYEYLLEFPGENVFSLEFTASKKIVVLTDRGAYLVNAKGEKNTLCEYASNELNHTDLKKGGLGAVSVDLYGNKNNTKVFLFDKGCKNVYETTYPNSIAQVIADEKYCAVVFDKEIRIIGSNNTETGLIRLDEVSLDAVISGGKLYVLGSGGISQYGLHETDGEQE